MSSNEFAATDAGLRDRADSGNFAQFPQGAHISHRHLEESPDEVSGIQAAPG